MFDLTLLIGLAVLVLVVAAISIRRVVVGPQEAVLAVRNGRDLGRLDPGVHRFFLGDLHLERFDLRESIQTIGGQEVLSRDRVPVKVSVLVRHRVVDPLVARERVQDASAHVHAATQIALRDAAAGLDLEDLLEGRAALGEVMRAPLATALAETGLELVDVAAKDVMVSGDLKRALSDVARARAEGLAKLERARGEAAALRKLANAARLLEDHAGLDRLKTLEVASRAADSATLVLHLHDPTEAGGSR